MRRLLKTHGPSQYVISWARHAMQAKKGDRFLQSLVEIGSERYSVVLEVQVVVDKELAKVRFGKKQITATHKARLDGENL